MKTIALLLPLLAAVYVSAHGAVSDVMYKGQRFPAGRAGSRSKDSAVWTVSNVNPNYGFNNPALSCGPNATPGEKYITVAAGDEIQVGWAGWPHNTGELENYLASCTGECFRQNPAQLKFFKIEEQGRQGNGQYLQQRIMNGERAPVRIPKDLAPGKYLLRHEIVSLHIAPNNPEQAEFYPSCINLIVTGTGTGRATSNLVNFPGGYNRNMDGFSKNIFGGPRQGLGPPVARLVGGAAPTPVTTGKATSTTSAGGKPTKTAGSSGSCKLRRRETADDDDEYEEIVIRRPRHPSRIMRRIVQEGSVH